MERYTNVPGKEVWEMTLCSWPSIENPGRATQLCSGGIWKASSALGSSGSSMRIEMFVLISREDLRCVGAPVFTLMMKMLVRFRSLVLGGKLVLP